MYFQDKKTQNLYEQIPDMKVIYCLLTGLSYREIGIKFYYHNTYKFVYKVRQLLNMFNLANRRQLAYFAVKNNLINAEILKEFLDA